MTAPAPEQKLTRLSVNMNAETTQQLKRLAGSRHLSYTEAVRRAIAIVAFIDAEQEAGRVIQSLDREANEVRELVLA